MDLGSLEGVLSNIESQLQRIATAIEMGALSGGKSGDGVGSSDVRATCTKLPDGRFQWEILPHHKVSKCKYCSAEVFWFKSKNDKWVIVNPDGFSHRDTCGRSGNPVETSKPEVPVDERVPF